MTTRNELTHSSGSDSLSRRALLSLGGGLIASVFLPDAGLAQPPGRPVASQKPILKGVVRRYGAPLIKQQRSLATLRKSPAVAAFTARAVNLSASPETKSKAADYLAAARRKATAKRPEAVRTKLLAASRLRAKSAAKMQARLKAKARRTPEAVLEQWVRRAKAGAPAPRNKTAFVIATRPTNLPTLEKTVRAALGLTNASLAESGLSLAPLFRNSFTTSAFLLTLNVPSEQMGRDVWNFAWALQKRGQFGGVYPQSERLALLQAPTKVDKNENMPSNVQWHIDEMRVREAWRVPSRSPRGRAQGEGAVIAHPDTGWAAHPQYDPSGIDFARSANTVGEQIRIGGTAARHGATPPDWPTLVPTFSHGTATASLMVSADAGGEATLSPDGAPNRHKKGDATRQNLNLCGVAPRARVVPIKCVDDGDVTGVIRINDLALARAIEYAVDINADVISISLGGTVHPATEAAIQRAIDNNVIVVAAAGQSYGAVNAVSPDDTVIEPAALPNVIAVAASTSRRLPWDDSHYGANVDITAPGHGVWHADFTGDGPNRGDPELRVGEGTSFSTALTAGAAALWVAHWGRDFLRRQYPDVPLANVFREVLRRSANNQSRSWDTRNFGPGILNAEQLLLTDLPPAAQIPTDPLTRQNTVVIIGDVFQAVDMGLIFLEDLASESGQKAAEALRAAPVIAEGIARATLGALRTAYEGALEVAATATGAAKAGAEAAVAALEKAIDDAAEAAEDATEAAAEAGEEAFEAAENFVSAAADTAGEAANAVADFFGW